jgi:hypothetical protein
MASMLSSRYFCKPILPKSEQVPYSSPSDLFRRPDAAQISFVKALRLAGFKTATISAHTWTGDGTAFAEEFDERHDLTTRFGSKERPHPTAQEVIDYTIDWIRENRGGDYFLYIHLMDAHYPHYFDADAQEFFGASSYDTESFLPAGGMKVPDSALSDEDRRYANALYDGDLRYTDRHIGRLAEFLRREQLGENTLMLVTADHGEHLLDQPGGRSREGRRIFTHGGPWLDPVARVPLIIHYPRKLKPGEFDHFSEGVDVGPTLLGLLGVSLPVGKRFDGIDLLTVINGETPPKDHVVTRRGIRTAEYKCIFKARNDVLLGETPPEPQTLTGQLYDLVADPWEATDLFQSRPAAVGELLERYRASLRPAFERYEAARSSEQPRSAFAISAQHMVTEMSLPKSDGRTPVDGWSLLKRGSDVAIVARNSSEPLSIHFPLPNGSYRLTLKLRGDAVVEVDKHRRELTSGPSVEFGDIEVRDEVFRATILPKGRGLALSHFGFNPLGGEGEDPEVVEERLERLRALGYVGD